MNANKSSTSFPNSENRPGWGHRRAPLRALLALLMSVGLLGSSVRATNLADMLAASELVFEGQVSEVVSRADPDPASKAIYTYVTFDVLDAPMNGAIAITLRHRKRASQP